MAKINSIALTQGYVLKAPTCGSCSFLRVDRVLPAWMRDENLRGAFWKLEINGIERTAICGKGGFTVKKRQFVTAMNSLRTRKRCDGQRQSERRHTMTTEQPNPPAVVLSTAQLNAVRSHQPKGSMCMSCAWARRNCEGLGFEYMLVIGKDDSTGAKIVRCTEHLSINTEKKTDFLAAALRST